VLLCICVMALCQDMPDGNIADLYEHGALKKPGGASVWKAACTNYRTWVMALTYGYAFGVELTVDNVISQYMYDQVRSTLDRGLTGV
jgi:NNP family nitrate/nitrite transporter-like MFS transporter